MAGTLENGKENLYQITSWSHELFALQARRGGTYIDATMGNGKDTVFLCRMAGKEGRVLAFDIQERALKATEKLLREEGFQAELYLDSHVHMDQYAKEETVDGICFNFGYLPGGDHSLSTKAETSVEAVKKGLTLLKKGGVMSLCVYSGKDTGFEEKEKLLAYMKGLDPKKYIVIVNYYYNRGNHPPIPAFIVKK